MNGMKHVRAHGDHDSERSQPPRCPAARPGAEHDESLFEAAREPSIRLEVWENEGGALATERNQTR